MEHLATYLTLLEALGRKRNRPHRARGGPRPPDARGRGSRARSRQLPLHRDARGNPPPAPDQPERQLPAPDPGSEPAGSHLYRPLRHAHRVRGSHLRQSAPERPLGPQHPGLCLALGGARRAPKPPGSPSIPWVRKAIPACPAPNATCGTSPPAPSNGASTRGAQAPSWSRPSPGACSSSRSTAKARRCAASTIRASPRAPKSCAPSSPKWRRGPFHPQLDHDVPPQRDHHARARHHQLPGPARRARTADVPRRLKRIIFTVPSAMPIAEQRIYRRWVTWAVRMIWETLGWGQWYTTKQGMRDTRPGLPGQP